jgi:exopolysaccharide/PEP-CTERM locus tyrosine autokinase
MGKIFHALKKHKKEKNISPTRSIDLENVEVHNAETKDRVPLEKEGLAPEKGQPAKTNFAPGESPEDKKIIELTEEVTDVLLDDDEIIPRRSNRSVDKKVDCQSGTDSGGNDINKIDKNIVCIKNPCSLEAELFKMLRGRICFPVSGKPPRSILITSAIPGDGKSFTASNLAVALAQNIGEYVLLVDCDLRKPSIHKKFGLGHVKGLSDHLSNGTRLSNLIFKTMIDKLSLLPAGKPPDNPSEILSSARMANLIDELKSRYPDRYLIIDSPPLLLAPETNAIAKHVDGIILVINCGSTPFNLLEEAIQNLDQKKILGAVVNRYDMPSARYYGYKKYRKYYEKLS